MGNTIEHFKPDFFIPGFAKSGTSSLHDLLNTHPDISMSKVKEPVYWNNKSFDTFNDFEIVRYSDLFEKNTKIKGESTTSYMFYDSFIKNINKFYKKSPKFIIILRNPIDRFISHVNWMNGLGLEKKDINEVVMDEKRLNFNEYDDLESQLKIFFGRDYDRSENSFYPDLSIIKVSDSIRQMYRSKLNDMTTNEIKYNIKK